MKYSVVDPRLPNIEILFKILSLPNIAKVMTYYSALRVCDPYSTSLQTQTILRSCCLLF